MFTPVSLILGCEPISFDNSTVSIRLNLAQIGHIESQLIGNEHSEFRDTTFSLGFRWSGWGHFEFALRQASRLDAKLFVDLSLLSFRPAGFAQVVEASPFGGNQ